MLLKTKLLNKYIHIIQLIAEGLPKLASVSAGPVVAATSAPAEKKDESKKKEEKKKQPEPEPEEEGGLGFLFQINYKNIIF